eukprot:5750440-Prymnesium_polylepis.1
MDGALAAFLAATNVDVAAVQRPEFGRLVQCLQRHAAHAYTAPEARKLREAVTREQRARLAEL